MNDFFKFRIDFNELNISREQLVLKIGGGDQNTIDAMQQDMDDVFLKAPELCEPCVAVKIIQTDSISIPTGTIQLKEQFNVGKKLAHYFKNSEKIAVFICSIGPSLENWSSTLMADGDVLKGYIADTIGSMAVDKTLQLFQEKFEQDLKYINLRCTNSYSPGYCEWAVSEQHKLFSLMPDEYEDVCLTASALMNPVKSISGFIGIGKDVTFKRFRCDDCKLTTCVYRQTIPTSGDAHRM